MTVTTNITITKRKLLTTNVEKENNSETCDFNDDIDRESDDIESELESYENQSDSELSTTNGIFAFESDQSDSDDGLKNVVDQNYVYHDNIEDSDKLPIANKYLKHVSSCTGLHLIQPRRVSKGFKEGQIGLFHLFIRKPSFHDCIRKWTNRNLDIKGKPHASIDEILE